MEFRVVSGRSLDDQLPIHVNNSGQRFSNNRPLTHLGLAQPRISMRHGERSETEIHVNFDHIRLII